MEDEASATDKVPTELILKHHNIVNGVVPIEIVNIDECIKPTHTLRYRLNIEYKFIFTKNIPKDYSNNVWCQRQFSLHSIESTNRFFLKIPSCLFTYKLEYNLTIYSIKYNQSFDKYRIVDTIASSNYTADIPSILIESTFKVDEYVQYRVENTGYVRSGTITEILDDNKYKIKTAAGYVKLNSEQKIVTVEQSQLLRNCIYAPFIVDVTAENEMIRELVLNTQDANIMDIYEKLSDVLFDFYFDEMYNIEQNKWNFKFLTSTMTVCICEFLCEQNFNYRVRCLFDSNDLIMQQVWVRDIEKTRNEILEGKDTLDLQNFDVTGFTCDICRCEASRYEFMYHCQSEDSHAFCISCMYQLIIQHQDMQQFIHQCLCKQLTVDCIDEIVTFCLGKIAKFH